MRRIALLVSCALAVTWPWAAAAQAPPAVTPTPEHANLGYYVGTWKIEGEMKASPFGPAGKLGSRDECEWFEGKFAVICRGQGTGPTGPIKSLGVLGYSAEEKVYTYYGLDNSPMTMMSVPRGTVSGDTWTYHDESKMGGQTIKNRFVIKQLSPDAYTYTWEAQGDGGGWNTILEGKATRQR